MAKGKSTNTLLEFCAGIIHLGNGIAVHVLEYLSIANSPAHGFKDLTPDFLALAGGLLSTQAGLKNATQSAIPLSKDILTDIEHRLLQAKMTLQDFEQISTKFLTNEKRHNYLSKNLRMMFVDKDFVKMRDSFSRCRAALGATSLMLTSIYGEATLEPSSNVGYTALAAVLNLPDPSKEQQNLGSTKSQARISQPLDGPASPPPKAPLPPLPNPILHTRTASQQSGTAGTPNNEHLPYSPSSSNFNSGSFAYNDFSSMAKDSNADRVSDITSIMSARPVSTESIPKHPVRAKLDPAEAPRWRPTRNIGPLTEAAKGAITSAVQQKDHRTTEQLLAGGVPANDPAMNNLIRTAITNHDLESIRLLLLYGTDANVKDAEGSTPLYAATAYSFYEAAVLLVKYGADPNISCGPGGENPFSISLTSAKFRFAKLFLEYGANVNALMTCGDTPFTQAMNQYTPMNLVELLLLYEAKLDFKNVRGETALFKAISAKRLDIFNRLLQSGADPNLPGPKILLWPCVATYQPKMLEALLEAGGDLRRAPGVLELAVSTNQKDAVAILLKHKVDVNVKKDGIYTPLCSAIRDDHDELVAMLLAAGADPNLPALDYPVFKCITYHRNHFLPRLIAAGADPNRPKGAIEAAVAHDNKTALLYLLEQNIDINARNAAGNSALTTAIRDNNLAMIDLLLSHGADPSMRGQDWPISMAVQHPLILAKLLPHVPASKIIKGALETAVVADKLESVKLLIAKGVSVEEKNGGVFSPLTTAIRENRKEIFRYLVDEAGADPNQPGEHLPIIKAIRRHRENDMSYIEHLLLKGADINLMYRGWNAVLQALDNGDMKILKLLASKGHPDLSAVDEYGRSVSDIMHERRLEEEEAVLLGGQRAGSPDIKVALGQLRDMVL